MIRLMLEGAPGSTLTVGVIRSTSKPEPDKISMVRSTEALPPVAEAVYENASILYLKPQILDHDHVQQIEAKLKAMQKAGNKKILLDLRDVAAGDMTDATLLANYLLKSGTIASLEGQKFPKQTFAADPSKAIQSTAPLVVLINHGTAGPAELVAAALLDNKRANLVGEHSFGEGTQQKLFELPDGAALILSVAKYESPDGKKIQDEGVTPDVVVASDSDKQATAGDDSLPATAPPPAAAVAASPTLKKLPEPQVDEQLNKALDLLKNKSA
jgi:carboxyl-terminal processing protease